MSGTTSVPSPTFGDTGFIAPAESAILAGAQADMNAAFGGNINPALSTPQGQLATSLTAITGDANDAFLFLANNVDPAYASGRMQDGIARIYFLTRNPAQPTTVEAQIVGAVGTPIPAGSRAQATDGNIYISTVAVTIPTSGTITVSFACLVNGPVPCPAGSLNTIYQSIPGWDTITNASAGVIGNVVESRAAFEARRSQSVALNSKGSLSSILAAVLAVPNVLDAYVFENDTAGAVTVGGQALLANSLYVAVSGGDPQAVAQAIWSKKAPGCGYTGNTTETVVDNNSGYSVPFPSYTVSFFTPAAVPIFFAVQIANTTAVPSTATASIQAAIIAAFAGADNGPRARIGSKIFASRFYAGIAGLGSWAQIVSVLIGTSSGGATLNDLLMQINQVPTISAANIAVTFV